MDSGAAAFEARRKVGIGHIARGVLQVTGRDARTFLNGLVTNDVLQMRSGDCRYAALLDHRGRALADLWIYDVDAGFLVDVDAALREKVRSLLETGRVSEDVHVLDRSEDFARYTVVGEQAPDLIHSRFGGAPPELGRWAEIPAGLIARTDALMAPGFELFLDPASPAIAAMTADDAVELLPATLEVLRLESGGPRYGIDFDEETILLEAPLESAVSFTKGCYVGQEVISRVANRGHLRHAIVRLLLETSPPRPHDVVQQEGLAVGQVTSAAFSSGIGKSIAFARVLIEASAPGNSVTVITAEGPRHATVVGAPPLGGPLAPGAAKIPS